MPLRVEGRARNLRGPHPARRPAWRLIASVKRPRQSKLNLRHGSVRGTGHQPAEVNHLYRCGSLIRLSRGGN